MLWGLLLNWDVTVLGDSLPVETKDFEVVLACESGPGALE